MFICYLQPNLPVRTFTPKYNFFVHLFVCCLRQTHIIAQTAQEIAMQVKMALNLWSPCLHSNAGITNTGCYIQCWGQTEGFGHTRQAQLQLSYI